MSFLAEFRIIPGRRPAETVPAIEHPIRHPGIPGQHALHWRAARSFASSCNARPAMSLPGWRFPGSIMLWRIGQRPLLIDLVPEPGKDDDHVLALYQVDGCWGALAKSNFVNLGFREPVYRNLRELVMSYFEHYVNVHQEKTIPRLYPSIGCLPPYPPQLGLGGSRGQQAVSRPFLWPQSDSADPRPHGAALEPRDRPRLHRRDFPYQSGTSLREPGFLILQMNKQIGQHQSYSPLGLASSLKNRKMKKDQCHFTCDSLRR